jgi:hypothetical protein
MVNTSLVDAVSHSEVTVRRGLRKVVATPHEHELTAKMVIDQTIEANSDVDETAELDDDQLRQTPMRSRNGIADAVLVVSTGILLVALAYSRSREGLSFSPMLFWAGQILLLAFVTFRILMPSTTAPERIILVLLYAAAQSATRWAYSPHIFSFSDELFHLRTLLDILSTRHLFQYNYSLPISPYYPGTENATAALAQVSSLSPFVSGVLIASISHVLLAACTILLFREVYESSRIACMAAILYMLNPHAAYFATSFIYETVALPFMVLAMYFAIRFAKSRPRGYRHFAGFLASFTIVVMTHHASVVFALELMGALTVGILFFRSARYMALPLILCWLTGAATFGCWIHFVAPSTIEYFTAPSKVILDGLTSAGQLSGTADLPASTRPLLDRIFSPASVLVTLGLLAAAIRVTRNRAALTRCFAWLGLGSYIYVLGLRVVVASGAELAGRTLAFTALLTAPPMAAVLVYLGSTNRRHRRPIPTLRRILAGTALSTVLLFGSIATSVQPWWDRLPGAFRIDGFGSGIDAVRKSKAEWAAEYLQPGSRIFGDKIALSALSTVSDLDPILDPNSLYEDDRLTANDAALMRNESAKYLDVDLRMSEQTPISGGFFATSKVATRPLDLAPLIKFDSAPGLSRIYDSGYGRVYDLRGGGQGSPYDN